MIKKWDYAELSKAAKAAGGPEKFVNMLEQASKKVGRKEMLPWIGVAAIGSSFLTSLIIKVVDNFKSIKHNKHEIEIFKEEIIKGINEYDATHIDEEGSEYDER